MNARQTLPGLSDFDFIIGSWQVQHTCLKERLNGCTEWFEFEGTSHTRKILEGWGNLEDNVLAKPGGAYVAAATRSFNASTGQWSIWWLDGRDPGRLDPPVVGSFQAGVGQFYADHELRGQPIQVRLSWFAHKVEPRWEQAFSADGGASWETNWRMSFKRVASPNA